MGAETQPETEEIEFTPEMLRTSPRAYRDRDSRVMSDEDIVEDIFLSMTEAKASGKSQDG
jgi:hypothetical protein